MRIADDLPELLSNKKTKTVKKKGNKTKILALLRPCSVLVWPLFSVTESM
jgi:hypothetical protein